MNSKQILQKAIIELKKSNKPTPELDSKILLGYILGKNKKVYLHENIMISEEDRVKYEKIIKIRAKGKPVSRILKKRNFWNFDFSITSFTLDPRAESELLVEVVLQYFKDKNTNLQILDLGSGSGCLGLSIAKELPMSTLVNVDACKKALNQVKINSKKLEIFSRNQFIHANWFNKNWTTKINSYVSKSKNKNNYKFDLIVCNPPYIKSKIISKLQDEVKKYDPILALDGGEDGCDSYRAIFSNIRDLLSKDGVIVIEVGYDILKTVKKIIKNSGFKILKIYKDILGIDRTLLIK
mgnify:CR=1 FL=1|tara:strand:+ start:318 stop:1202 length:885 start_codon:yes stop_codon:yes gene_type:complete